MWKGSVIASFFLASIFTACVSDDDEEEKWNAAEVCPESKRGTFTDERDGQVYKYTTIGDQVWMAENLKYDAEYSVCNAEEQNKDNDKILKNFCEENGRFYSLLRGGEFASDMDSLLLYSVCPNGWHVPSLDEWTELINNVGGLNFVETANRLKAYDEWIAKEGVVENVCGFSALPSGAYANDDFGLYYYGYDAIFWTSTEKIESTYYSIRIQSDVSIFTNLPKMSIRCLKD